MAYCFYIDYLGRDICLEPEELAVWEGYSKGRISYTEFRERARDILREKNVPRGIWISTMMYILGLYERGQYWITPEEVGIPEEVIEEEIEEEIEEIEEEEEIKAVRLVEVEFEWYGRTEYCKKAGHHIVTECKVTGYFECLEDYFNDYQDTIRDKLAERLWKGYTDFLANEYILVYEETDEGFSRFDITRTKEKYDVDKLLGMITSVSFYRGNTCGDVVKRLEYYDSILEDWITDEFDEFLSWLEEECGISE